MPPPMVEVMLLSLEPSSSKFSTLSVVSLAWFMVNKLLVNAVCEPDVTRRKSVAVPSVPRNALMLLLVSAVVGAVVN